MTSIKITSKFLITYIQIKNSKAVSNVALEALSTIVRFDAFHKRMIFLLEIAIYP